MAQTITMQPGIFANFVKTGHFKMNMKESNPLWTFETCLPNKMGSHNYLIVSDNIVKKIGASANKIGTNNVAGYSCGNGGQPSDRTIGIHYYIAQELMKGNQVEFWVKMCPSPLVNIENINGNIIQKECSIDPKIVEDHLLEDYKQRCGGLLPDWNMQEQGRSKDWEPSIKTINIAFKQKKIIPYDSNENYDMLMKLYHWKHNKIPIN